MVYALAAYTYSKTSVSRTPLGWIMVKLDTFTDLDKSWLFLMFIQLT